MIDSCCCAVGVNGLHCGVHINITVEVVDS
jgi:hypothetical protein